MAERNGNLGWGAGIVLFVVMLGVLVSFKRCGNDPPAVAEDAAPVQKYTEDVFSNYTPDQYPKTFKEYGVSGVERIKRVEREAAAFVAKSPKCDKIELVALSDSRSSQENIVVFLDCANGQRFYVSERDLKGSQNAVSQFDKAISRKYAMDRCLEEIPRHLRHPGSFDPSIITGSAFSVNESTGNALVLMEFTAKNDLGVDVQNRARCIFVPGSDDPEITIETL